MVTLSLYHSVILPQKNKYSEFHANRDLELLLSNEQNSVDNMCSDTILLAYDNYELSMFEVNYLSVF